MNGKRHGIGRYEDLQNKEVFHGEFADDCKQGFGTVYKKDSVTSGVYSKDNPVGENVTIEMKPKAEKNVIEFDKKGNEKKRARLDVKI